MKLIIAYLILFPVLFLKNQNQNDDDTFKSYYKVYKIDSVKKFNILYLSNNKLKYKVISEKKKLFTVTVLKLA